eukprot:gnl/MRDRNA2_/MRDRNA2_118272_c0_seq1.p1 gnl/MRDRNA2_/MRDRNA2_118272_c0~~gnl/MRDRNA2_/MRDRNA2_118272_c0_seq1.p1  ORF type:complete len:612 (+),score=165.12 gnl/MRDRNA2_/MRDRNA2_118272_c0_seq1:92-1927(+)
MASNSSAPAEPQEAKDMEDRPLQVVQLDIKNKCVTLNEDGIGRIEKNLLASKAQRVAIVSIMGAFRTGKSFFLDLMLRYLRYQEETGNHEADENAGLKPPRETDKDVYDIPAWLLHKGDVLTEGTSDEDETGFRWRGGMDKCTEGIWIWSRPFVRVIGGKRVAILLMDTQGAWDAKMTKEQSATIFGLTALLSSKQIYNISRQIQEDKVENLSFFMHFAQACLHKGAAAKAGESADAEDLAACPKCFQCLDFLVRDWSNFEDEWSVDECLQQMKEHLDTHLNPEQVVEKDTVEALNGMFETIGTWLLPHPGLAIENKKWTGAVKDISPDFLRFADMYLPQIFNKGLTPKAILGQVMTPKTFAPVFRSFTAAFKDAAPQTMSFTQAMAQSTSLLAKEQAMRNYNIKMKQLLKSNTKGLDESELKSKHTSIMSGIMDEYCQAMIFGSDEEISAAKKDVTDQLQTLLERYMEDNKRLLERSLVSLAGLLVIAVVLFVLDRVSDYTCDWWLDVCVQGSKLMMLGYLASFGWIGWNTYVLYKERGQIATVGACSELWKESLKLACEYGEVVKNLDVEKMKVMAADIKNTIGERVEDAKAMQRSQSAPASTEDKKAK